MELTGQLGSRGVRMATLGRYDCSFCKKHKDQVKTLIAAPDRQDVHRRMGLPKGWGKRHVAVDQCRRVALPEQPGLVLVPVGSVKRFGIFDGR